jgi:hypothetical protein
MVSKSTTSSRIRRIGSFDFRPSFGSSFALDARRGLLVGGHGLGD